MKLRILDDSVRLRLPRGEVERLCADGRVEATTHFGPGPQQRLVYALVVDPHAEVISAVITDREIAVHVPSATAQAWAQGDEVSLRAEQAVGQDRTLSLLIEKDFKCVVARPGEEEYDGYANPNLTC